MIRSRWKWQEWKRLCVIGSVLFRLLEPRQTTPANWIPLKNTPFRQAFMQAYCFHTSFPPFIWLQQWPSGLCLVYKCSYFFNEADRWCKKKYDRKPFGFSISRMKTKLGVVRSHDLALVSHVSECPYWLCHRPHSSVVQHLLICNNNFIWNGEYVTTQSPTMTEKQRNTCRERARDTFHPAPLAVWHKEQHCCGVFVTSEILAWLWMQRSGWLYSQSQTRQLRPSDPLWAPRDDKKSCIEERVFSTFGNEMKLGATLNLLGLMQYLKNEKYLANYVAVQRHKQI